MPYYRWKGVNILGENKRGLLFARNSAHLDMLLMTREIALISYKPQRQWMKKSIRMRDKLQFFRQLSILIDSGVLLSDALGIVGDQVNHPPFQELVHAIALRVQEGMSLGMALDNYPQVFDQITIQLLYAGEESGRMAETLDSISGHMAITQDFYRNVRAALFLPAITLTVFIAIVMIIFLVIMPRFIDIFSSMHREVPPLTRRILMISEFIRTPLMGVIVLIVVLLGGIGWRLTRKGKGRQMVDCLLMIVPLVGTMMQQRFFGYMMQALSVLLQGGMPVVQALSVVRKSVRNRLFQKHLQDLEMQVASGSSLSDAIIRQRWVSAAPEMIAMIEVGQESGRLSLLLSRVGYLYYERISQQLSRLTMLIQPLIMVVLGLLVALLIFAVYGPIFTMSSVF